MNQQKKPWVEYMQRACEDQGTRMEVSTSRKGEPIDLHGDLRRLPCPPRGAEATPRAGALGVEMSGKGAARARGRTASRHRSRCLASTALPALMRRSSTPTSEYIRMTMHTYTGLTPMLFRAFLGCASHRATRTAIQVLFFPKKTQIG
jgi:hypothetical protein